MIDNYIIRKLNFYVSSFKNVVEGRFMSYADDLREMKNLPNPRRLDISLLDLVFALQGTAGLVLRLCFLI